MFEKTRNVSKIFTFIFCLIAFSVLSVYAEEDLQFPETAEEITKALNVELPEKIKGRGSLKSQKSGTDLFGKKKSDGNTRGLGAIVDDESALDEAPKIGALILFDYNSAVIQAQSLPLLREYGKALQTDLKDMVLVVAGHTDSKGSDEYNLSLSERRAESVKQFLVSEFQVEEERLLVKPYGERKPIKDNETTEGRAKNRRVEFIRIQ
ncbi:MAG: OmpA family protein [bacterium]|nr:OmpA family protein [bacterium]